MSESKRNYTTWEEDFCSDRCELHGYEDELVAVIDKAGDEWTVCDPDGKELARCVKKAEAQGIAEKRL